MNLKPMIMNLHYHHQVSSLIGYMSQEYIIINHVRKYHWNNTSFIGVNINSRTSLCLSV